MKDERLVNPKHASLLPPSCLFDHLVGAAEQRERKREAERLGGIEVDDQLDFGGLLDRQVGRLLALENAAGVDAGAMVRFRQSCLRSS